MNKEELLALHSELCKDALDIMVKKNQDYSGGSGDPFQNFRGSAQFGIEPELGLMLRMGDKMQRVSAFLSNGTLAVQDEGIRDIAVDLINYSVLLYGLLTERRDAKVKATEESVSYYREYRSVAAAMKDVAHLTGRMPTIKKTILETNLTARLAKNNVVLHHEVLQDIERVQTGEK